MTDTKSLSNQLKVSFYKLFPVLLIVLFFFVFPPVAWAIVLAFFTAPILMAVRTTTKLPLTLATLLVMICLILLIFSLFYISIYGLLEFIPIIQGHIGELALDLDYIGIIISFVEERIIAYSEALIEYAFSMVQAMIQQVVNLGIFLICYFLALRESGNSREWFLIYFPKKTRPGAQQTLRKASEIINTFFYVEARLIFLTFIILLIGFFSLKFQSPLSLALIVSLVDSIPFLGIGLFLIPMILFHFYVGEIWTGAFLLFIYIVALIVRQLAESYMWARTFEIRPIHAFLVLACALYAFGLIGILLSPFLLFAAFKMKHHPLFNE